MSEQNFSLLLIHYRKLLGLTQHQMAKFLDVSLWTVFQWEKGYQPSTLAQEGALARLRRRAAELRPDLEGIL